MRGWLIDLRLVVIAAVMACVASVAPDASLGQERTISIVDLYQGTSLSALARGLGVGGYELQDGTWVSFEKWYHANWIDLHADFLTELADDFGVLWGVGTGEWAPKYRIDPSLKLGIITQAHPRANATLSLTATTTLGGSLTELPCIADYGDIGGVQSVNCRLAAGELPPAETLKYLVKADPTRLYVALTYRANF